MSIMPAHYDNYGRVMNRHYKDCNVCFPAATAEPQLYVDGKPTTWQVPASPVVSQEAQREMTGDVNAWLKADGRNWTYDSNIAGYITSDKKPLHDTEPAIFEYDGNGAAEETARQLIKSDVRLMTRGQIWDELNALVDAATHAGRHFTKAEQERWADLHTEMTGLDRAIKAADAAMPLFKGPMTTAGGEWASEPVIRTYAYHTEEELSQLKAQFLESLKNKEAVVVPSKGLRMSTSEKTEYIEHLGNMYAEGRLNDDEFQKRADVVNSATYKTDLILPDSGASILEGLPDLPVYARNFDPAMQTYDPRLISRGSEWNWPLIAGVSFSLAIVIAFICMLAFL